MKPSVQFFLHLSKLHTVISRRLDGALNGLSLNEFIVLLQLSKAPDVKMRRVDLAESIGLTASGVTRLLLPMEKVGLVEKEVNAHDARSSYVVLASGGKKKLAEGLERADTFCDDVVAPVDPEQLLNATKLLQTLLGSVR